MNVVVGAVFGPGGERCHHVLRECWQSCSYKFSLELISRGQVPQQAYRVFTDRIKDFSLLKLLRDPESSMSTEPACDLFLGLSRIRLLQELQSLPNPTTVLNLHLVVMVLEHNVSQGSGSSLAHGRTGAAQQGHQQRDTPQLEYLTQRQDVTIQGVVGGGQLPHRLPKCV